MSELPLELQIDPVVYVQDYENDVVTVSNGKLYDFSISSVLRVIGESQALRVSADSNRQLELIEYISAALLEGLGFSRLQGTRALGIARFRLDNKYDQSFLIRSGTRIGLSVNGTVIFETLNDLIIPANVDSTDPLQYDYCKVDARALNVGSEGNQPQQQGTILQPVLGLDSVWIDESTNGGNDEETPDAFLDRVSVVIGKFLESQFSLVQSAEFESEVRSILGNKSIVIAIPDLASDGVTKQLASMHLFALNPDETSLNAAQKRSIIEEIAVRSPLVQGRIYISDLAIVLIDINISIEIASTDNVNVICDDINQRLRDTFSVENTLKMRSLELYEAVYQVKLAKGLFPIVQWKANNDPLFEARNLPLPRITQATEETLPARIRTIKITIEPSGGQIVYG